MNGTETPRYSMDSGVFSQSITLYETIVCCETFDATNGGMQNVV